MKIEISKKIFERHLENVSKALLGNPALPSLNGILITATESNIQLLASNGNLSIKDLIEPTEGVKIIEPGKILAPGSLLRSVVKKQSNQIHISTNETSLEISSEGSTVTLQLLNTNDYPTIDFSSMGKDLVVDGEELERLIGNVSFAAAENDKRAILNGVNLKAKDGFLTASATNSFRLAVERIEVDSNVDFDITILSKNLKNFIPKNVNGPLTINVNDSKIITKHKSATNLSSLIDGVYPQVGKLIPSSFDKVLYIDGKKLSELIDKATVVSQENNKVVRLSINPDTLTVESKRKEIGTSTVQTNDLKWKGEELVIALNSQFLKEAVSKFKGRVAIGFNGPHDPLVIKGKETPTLIQLVLPHRSY